MFINFHASPRRRGARPRFEWWQYRPVPGSNSLIINSLSQNTIESRTTGSSFTPFRAGTCFSAASTLSLSPPRCCPQVLLSFEHASPLSDFRPKKRKKKKWRRRKTWKSRRRSRIRRRLEQKLVLEYGLEYPSLHVSSLLETVLVPHGCPWSGRKSRSPELLHRDLTSEGLKIESDFYLERSLGNDIFLEGSCCF